MPKEQQRPEGILNLLRKIQTLAERGERHEAQAAQRRLTSLTARYGIKLEELSSPQIRSYGFAIASREEQDLLGQCVLKVVNTDALDVSLNTERTQVYVKLTPQQYIDVDTLYQYYRQAWQQERERLLSDALKAFVLRYGLYSETNDDAASVGPRQTQAEIESIISLVDRFATESLNGPKKLPAKR